MLENNAMNEMRAWLDTLSPPATVRENQEAMVRELTLIAETLHRAGATSVSQVKSVFEEFKRVSTHRGWPTPREIIDVVAKLRGDRDIHGRGDRGKLNFDERALLEQKIIPAARRWISIPGLKDHGKATLEFWGETV